MKHRTIAILLLAAALLTVAACRSQRDSAAVPPAPDKSAEPAAARQYSVISFTGTVDGISVSGQVRIARDSLIWCNVTKLIEVGRAMATPDSVWARSTLLGINEAVTFQQAQRRAKTTLSFAQIQALLESDDAEQQLADLARNMGHLATIRITRRQQVEQLTFPFNK